MVTWKHPDHHLFFLVNYMIVLNLNRELSFHLGRIRVKRGQCATREYNAAWIFGQKLFKAKRGVEAPHTELASAHSLLLRPVTELLIQDADVKVIELFAIILCVPESAKVMLVRNLCF
jgi:hypothetical protein